MFAVITNSTIELAHGTDNEKRVQRYDYWLEIILACLNCWWPKVAWTRHSKRSQCVIRFAKVMHGPVLTNLMVQYLIDTVRFPN